jgi:hypothetical protein
MYAAGAMCVINNITLHIRIKLTHTTVCAHRVHFMLLFVAGPPRPSHYSCYNNRESNVATYVDVPIIHEGIQHSVSIGAMFTGFPHYSDRSIQLLLDKKKVYGISYNK